MPNPGIQKANHILIFKNPHITRPWAVQTQAVQRSTVVLFVLLFYRRGRWSVCRTAELVLLTHTWVMRPSESQCGAMDRHWAGTQETEASLPGRPLAHWGSWDRPLSLPWAMVSKEWTRAVSPPWLLRVTQEAWKTMVSELRLVLMWIFIIKSKTDHLFKCLRIICIFLSVSYLFFSLCPFFL